MKYYSINEIKNELCNHLITSDKMVFKNSIKSIEEQRNRFHSILVQLEEALENRFKQKSFTYNRFDGMIAEVSENLINNYDYIKKIMDTFDDNIKDYRHSIWLFLKNSSIKNWKCMRTQLIKS